MSYQRTMDGAIRGLPLIRKVPQNNVTPSWVVVRLFSWIGSDSASNVAQMILTG